MMTIVGNRLAVDRDDITKPCGEGVAVGHTYAVAVDVIIVASITTGINWAAYITDRGSIKAALDHGDKLPEAAARALFPGVAERYRL